MWRRAIVSTSRPCPGSPGALSELRERNPSQGWTKPVNWWPKGWNVCKSLFLFQIKLEMEPHGEPTSQRLMVKEWAAAHRGSMSVSSPIYFPAKQSWAMEIGKKTPVWAEARSAETGPPFHPSVYVCPFCPLDCKEIQPVHPKGNQPWIFTGGTDAEAETPILWPPDAKSWLISKDPDAGKDWRREEKGTTEDELVGWFHWLSGHEFE